MSNSSNPLCPRINSGQLFEPSATGGLLHSADCFLVNELHKLHEWCLLYAIDAKKNTFAYCPGIF